MMLPLPGFTSFLALSFIIKLVKTERVVHFVLREVSLNLLPP